MRELVTSIILLSPSIRFSLFNKRNDQEAVCDVLPGAKLEYDLRILSDYILLSKLEGKDLFKDCKLNAHQPWKSTIISRTPLNLISDCGHLWQWSYTGLSPSPSLSFAPSFSISLSLCHSLSFSLHLFFDVSISPPLSIYIKSTPLSLSFLPMMIETSDMTFSLSSYL